MKRIWYLSWLLLPAVGCSLLLPFPGEKGRPCESGGCKAGYHCVNNICQATENGPITNQRFTFTGHAATLSSASPSSYDSYAVVDDGFEFSDVTCGGPFCAVGGFIP
jgi:hypothetical protein